MKKRIYLNEYNLSMGNTYYFPLATGMLRAFSETFLEVREKYEFMPFLYKIDTVENIVSQYDNPYMAAFSASIWNYNLSIEVAKRVKQKYPDCIIVFGGPSVPEKQYPIDHIITGEGEQAFVEVLIGRKTEYIIDLDNYPSPYTQGLFDYLTKEDVNFQAIIETNRGCPYSCSYCYWGNGVSKKYRFFSIDYIYKVAEWIAKNEIKYVFCADSNFGVFDRDVEIAEIFDDIKARYGYPEKFRVCYGKGTKESIFKTAKALHKAGLAKSVTLSKQSNNPEALKNVNRENIKATDFDKLQERYSRAGISTYTEFILGLPGETAESFKKGVLDVLKYAGTNNLFIYHCTVLPNTEMAEFEYRHKLGIQTVRVPISEVHCEVRSDGHVVEFEDIIIQTNTMTTEEWIALSAWSWEIQLIYSLGYEPPIPEYIKEWFKSIARGITEGKRRCQVLPEYGDIYYEPEEAAYLILTKDNALKQYARERIIYGRKSQKQGGLK